MDVALIGPYPPPYGGISTHIRRLRDRLDARGIRAVVYDDTEVPKAVPGVVPVGKVGRWLPGHAFRAPESILHYHSDSWKVRALLGLLGAAGRGTIVSVHGSSLGDCLRGLGPGARRLFVLGLRQTKFLIADNEEIRDLALSLGVAAEKTAVIPAFIPPAVDGAGPPLPGRVADFMERHAPVISAAGTVRLYRGEDLYGLDMMLRLVARLRSGGYPNVGLICTVTAVHDREYCQGLKAAIDEQKLGANVLLVEEPLEEFYPVLRGSDLFVRPTNTDGDSVSVREALWLRVPTVASDACPRPAGAILFRSRDDAQLCERVVRVLENGAAERQRLETLVIDDNFERVLGVYEQVASTCGRGWRGGR